jgi:hypothetical protein
MEADMNRWVEETFHPHWRVRLEAEEVLHETKTEHQHLVIFKNQTWGTVLMLDGVCQLTTLDEFIYHEMMAHVPLMALDKPKRVLVVGGGVHLAHQVRDAVVGLRDGVGVERVRLDDVRAGRQVVVVDGPDDLGARQAQEIVVTANVVRNLIAIGEALSPKARLVELVALDHGAHRAVQDQDALGQRRTKRGSSAFADLGRCGRNGGRHAHSIGGRGERPVHAPAPSV